MLKKLFKYIESRASHFAAQDIVTMLKNGKTKAVWGIIILMGIGRLVLGKTEFFAGSFRPIVASFMVIGLTIAIGL